MNSNPVLTVTQLNTYVKSVIENDKNLSFLYICGEISNFTNHYRSGHFYFTLKDDKCAVKAVMFRSSAQRLAFMPENGMKVVISGRVSVYDRDGVYQVYAEDMQPDGIGALTVAYEQLKKKLEAQGLFDSFYKKPIPSCPGRVGVITSPTGAAVRDIFNVLSRRFPLARVVFVPVQVQGLSAAPQLVEAVERFNRYGAADVIIIGRGGGSIEDLWAFNDEKLAHTIFKSGIPVISAVGHETDFTICDFVADLRAPTPSAAAELAVPERLEQYSYVEGLLLHARSVMISRIKENRIRLTAAAQSPALKSPAATLSILRQRFDQITIELYAAERALLAEKRLCLSSLAAKLDSLSPLAVLARGYSVAMKDGGVIASVSALSPGDGFTLRLTDGEAVCRAEQIKTFEEDNNG